MRTVLFVFAAFLALGAVAGASSLDAGIPSASLHGAKGVKNHSIGHLSLKRNSVSCQNFSLDVVKKICGGLPSNGKDGSNGASGKNGANGSNGTNGHDGVNGLNGTNGIPGVVSTHVVGPDSSVCGNDWANDDYTRTLQFIPQDDGTIHVIRQYSGTFVTIEGVAKPNGPCPEQLPALLLADPNLQTGGVTGTFTGFDVVVVTGGNFVPNGTCADPCTTAEMVIAFFPGGTTAINHGWEYHYHTDANGDWTNADPVRGGNQGNIDG